MSNKEIGYIVYEGAKVKSSNIGQNAVVGEFSYVESSNLGDFVQINRRNFIDNTSLGDYTYTGMNTVIKYANIGKYCSISWNVSITGNLHDYKNLSPHPFSNFKSFGFVESNTPLDNKRINVGNDVWIGMNSCILPGLIIGNGAVIGAGSVVTKDVPPYAIVAGNPAKVIKYRFNNEVVAMLQSCEWWNWPREVIKDNLDLFRGEITEEKCNKIQQIHNDSPKEV